jgi:dolichyl-phosphate beta-D-mannosyltransferase
MFFFIISLLIAGFLLCVKLFAHQSPTAGSVMLAVLPFVLSVQLVLTALTIDVSNESNNFKK